MGHTTIKNTKENNWYVITGGPSSGKTTTVNFLKERGFLTTDENARHFFDVERLKGRSAKDVRMNQEEFQLELLQLQMDLENRIDPNAFVFLDRAIPDSLAYHRFLNLKVDQKLLDALENVSYKKIFIMDPLPLVKDYVRIETEKDQLKIHDLITEVYESLPFPVIHVPVLPAEERVDFILKNL